MVYQGGVYILEIFRDIFKIDQVLSVPLMRCFYLHYGDINLYLSTYSILTPRRGMFYLP